MSKAPADQTAWILAQRPARVPVNPFQPHDFFLEEEPDATGGIVCSGCILLTNKECPWHCLMCDLWKHTLSASVPPGAIPTQIDYALSRFAVRPQQLKLYNSGSFFDPAAVPPADYPDIAGRLEGLDHVIVECHPRLIGPRALKFRDLLRGSLEVAIGLETIHPEVLPRLNKRFTLEHFARAAEFLRREGIGLRVFVLVKPPFVDDTVAIEWALKSARFAFDCGAGVVSLIPTRPGNGALDRLMLSGEFSPPSLALFEKAFEQALESRRGRLFADTWDLKKFASCPACFSQREHRLRAMNRRQKLLPPISCSHCKPASMQMK